MADVLPVESTEPQTCASCGKTIPAGEQHVLVVSASIHVHDNDECWEAYREEAHDVVHKVAETILTTLEQQIPIVSIGAVVNIAATVQSYITAHAHHGFSVEWDTLEYALVGAKSCAAEILEKRHPDLYSAPQEDVSDAEEEEEELCEPPQQTPSYDELTLDQRAFLGSWLSNTLGPRGES